MKLEQVQTAFATGPKHLILGRVDKDPSFHHEGRQLAGQGPRGLNRDVARTLVIEHEAQRVGTGFHCGQAVREVRDAADLYFH
jgi:hypothetical protein